MLNGLKPGYRDLTQAEIDIIKPLVKELEAIRDVLNSENLDKKNLRFCINQVDNADGKVNTLKDYIWLGVNNLTKYKNDKPFMMILCTYRGNALRFASEALKEDKEVVMAQVLAL